MFDRKKDEYADAGPTAQSRNDTTAPVPLRSKSPEASVDLTPPPRAAVSLPEKPRRLPEMPHGTEGRQNQPRGADQKKLIIGRDIVFNGKISSLDRLVVEGKVEATLKDCREIEIAESGTFKGHVEFERADISGIFEGELTAREHLVVRATGRVTGKIRFGELEIERGGQVIGDVQAIDDVKATDDVEAVDENAAAERKKARNAKGKGRAAK